jgi:predicted outer membrane repeat protein
MTSKTKLMLIGRGDPTIQMIFASNVATTSGGILYADTNSIVTTSQGKFVFHNNTASLLGGAFAVYDTVLEMVNCYFVNNIAESGGGMFLFRSNITLQNSGNSTSPILIRSNNAIEYGGFIAASYAIITMYHCSFANNSALYGGVVQISHSNLTLEGNNKVNGDTIHDSPTWPNRANQASSGVVQDNIANITGGFIDAYNCTISIRKLMYQNNSATFGGVFRIAKATLTLVGSNDHATLPMLNESIVAPASVGIIGTANNLFSQIEIQSNMATENGGFVDATDSTITIEGYSFRNNSAKYGGTCHISNSDLTVIGSSDPTKPVSFNSNAARVSGGAIFIDTNSTFTTRHGSFLFRQNMASLGGGALFAIDSLMEMENCHFVSNVANSGGGIVMLHSTVNMKNSNPTNPTVVQSNTATENGAFVEAYSSTFNIDTCDIKNNSALFGGVFSVSNTNLTLVGSSDPTKVTKFENNIATDSGGVFYARENSIIKIHRGLANFHDNMAMLYGGAFYAMECIIEMFNCHFENNSAIHGGGILMIHSKMNMNNTDFQNNTADQVRSYVLMPCLIIK